MDWFTPDALKVDPHVKKRVRMFLISHLFGPFLGFPIPLFLFLNDQNPWPHVHILALSIFAFWVFPFAVRPLARHYTWLAITSVLNLSFAILWGSYHYGGASSPFLMWLLVVPLLAFFYLGSSLLTRAVIFTQTAVGLGAFYLAFLQENSFPSHIPIHEMVGVGIISAFCATTYVFFMASYYTRVVDSQSELLREIDRHRETMLMLTEAKDEAERANGAKSDFLAKMSHELRTPLNAVLGYSEIMLEDAELDGRGEQIADLQKISAAGKHLLAMVNDILDISKIEAGRMDLHQEVVDLDKFIDEVEFTGRPLAAKNTNIFSVHRGESLGAVHVDATKLRQAVLNLLSNAAKFTNNGHITLSVDQVDVDGKPWLRIGVEDSGLGISQEQQANLFTNFSQASPAIAAKFGGTGLGLSLSQNLCRLMGGLITVDSELGRGSCFTIHVPVTTAALPNNEDRQSMIAANAEAKERKSGFAGLSGASTQHGVQGKILIVDDDREFLQLAERLLVKEGYSPIATDAPEAALQLARTVRPSAILLDILMPGIDGWQVLRSLRADPATAAIPIVITSILEDRKAAIDNGADGFVAKPLDGRKLTGVLASAKLHRQQQTSKGVSNLPQAV
ncbi:ATP-binding response regulator [Neomesorhizobium albiziae]|uniref:ATP-binding response regulator n=1 Tax=Neomesorhizobium albiziae TaxID=335020 RepID=UPI00165FC65E|nr:ATP-binding protein [Mesorhizobium albiziae]